MDIDLIKKIPLFRDISKNSEAIESISSMFTEKAYTSSSNVITEDEENGNTMFIIKHGIVEILKKTKEGDEYLVTELSADMNVFFGELALIDSDKRSATVRCKTDCEFYVLERDDFLAFGEKFPSAALFVTRELAKILSERLRKANNDILTLFTALVEEVEISGGIN